MLTFSSLATPHPPTTPETGLVYSVFSTSRLCAAVTVIFLSNICFSHLLISLGFSSSTASHIAAATDVHLIPLLKSLNCASPNLAPGHFKTCHLQFRSTCQEPVKLLHASEPGTLATRAVILLLRNSIRSACPELVFWQFFPLLTS